MHPTFSQRRAILEGLRERTRKATADFYQKPGVKPPPLAPLFIVKSIGNNSWAVIDRATDKVITTRTGHNNATAHARELEAKKDQFDVKQFGRFLRDWALRISLTRTAFAFFGSHV